MAKVPFRPPKLPPRVDYEKLVSEIAAARAALARLDALLSQLKNPRLLARTFITREAVLSSQIEGTEATLGEVLEQEAREVKREETPGEKDYREIINYRQALERGIEILKKQPLSENIIKELHSILLHSTRGHNKAPGEFRRRLVYIGKPGATIEEASYVPPLPPEIPELFSNLERYMHGNERDPLVQIGIAHYQFEAIHPFEDGNGRIGRLIISLLLYQKELLSYPFIYLSEFFEKHRRDYYDLLRNVSEKGAWEDWLNFFLRGLRVQAHEAEVVVRKVIELHERLKVKAPELNSRYAHEFLEAMFARPYFSSRTIRHDAGIRNIQTLYGLITKFLRAGIISDVTKTQRRNKVYRFDELAKILEG